MSLRLNGKVAIVTGASKGIGASIAKYLAADGAAVVVNYSTSKEGADRVVAEIVSRGGKAIAVQANVAQPADIKRLVAATIKAYGKLDILINNAGIYALSPLEEVTAEFFHQLFDINVLGLILMSQEVVKHFGPHGGSIVNISSVASTLAAPNFSVYGASKAAVDLITKSLSKELGARKIRVNSINPGLIETEGVHTAGFHEGDFRNHAEAQTPLGRIGQPEDVAPVVAFLVSDDGAWITGETIAVSGGFR